MAAGHVDVASLSAHRHHAARHAAVRDRRPSDRQLQATCEHVPLRELQRPRRRQRSRRHARVGAARAAAETVRRARVEPAAVFRSRAGRRRRHCREQGQARRHDAPAGRPRAAGRDLPHRALERDRRRCEVHRPQAGQEPAVADHRSVHAHPAAGRRAVARAVAVRRRGRHARDRCAAGRQPHAAQGPLHAGRAAPEAQAAVPDTESDADRARRDQRRRVAVGDRQFAGRARRDVDRRSEGARHRRPHQPPADGGGGAERRERRLREAVRQSRRQHQLRGDRFRREGRHARPEGVRARHRRRAHQRRRPDQSARRVDRPEDPSAYEGLPGVLAALAAVCEGHVQEPEGRRRRRRARAAGRRDGRARADQPVRGADSADRAEQQPRRAVLGAVRADEREDGAEARAEGRQVTRRPAGRAAQRAGWPGRNGAVGSFADTC
ncbi:hypothetical protein BVI434_430003 [Burkholderia vietnamiensis]|nr:hypothetical protein BVI434_430003 [Burkholderia vietnamiensis]